MRYRFLLVSVGLPLQLFAQVPTELPATAPACLADLYAYGDRRMAGRAPTAELMRQLVDERTTYAKRCATKFDVAGATAADLVAVASMYNLAEDSIRRREVLERAYADPRVTGADRGAVIVSLIGIRNADTLNTAHDARIERLVAEADQLPPIAFPAAFRAHYGAEYFYYKISDAKTAPDGVIRHAMWMIENASRLSPQERRVAGVLLVNAFANAATRIADGGDTRAAIDLLRRGQRETADLPTSASLATTIRRYEMVGAAAPPITAARWLNAPAGTTEMSLRGAVTILEFTAHWCGPCKQTYPGLNRLRDQFGSQGLQVVLATELYGYYRSEWNLTPEEELPHLVKDFEQAQIRVPIAIDDPTRPTRRNGPNTTHSGVNTQKFAVGAIPQIQLIDRQGKIRYTMLGFQEEIVKKLVAELLAERPDAQR